jgi:hypothetical protein
LHSVLLPTNMYNRTVLFGSTLLSHGCHFDYWNQSLNIHMYVCYLDCHEAGLCCYLVIHIENLLFIHIHIYYHPWIIIHDIGQVNITIYNT